MTLDSDSYSTVKMKIVIDGGDDGNMAFILMAGNMAFILMAVLNLQ